MRDLVRALPLTDVEVEGRTLVGQALRWDTLYRVSDDGRRWYQEGFRRGSFAESLTNRRGVFELRREHYDQRVGTVAFTEDTDGLLFRATVDYGDEGDDELSLVAQGRRTGVSIRYRPQSAERSAPPWWRTKVDVRELSLTARPQYGADAMVTAMRSYQRDPAIAALLDWQPPQL